MEEWDLRAVVRGRTSNINGEIIAMESSPSSCFFPLMSVEEEDELFNSYPHLFDTGTAFNELEEFYKPFYPVVALGSASASASSSSSSSSSLSSPPLNFAVTTSLASLPEKAEIRASVNPKLVKEPANKYKKRKNRLKRVVKEVKEEALSSDMWAWRKYGQKPIKGSPYPRSYYRCSSLKGCAARKQVERSPTNPEIFIITYTAEHTHAHPTRRNSLAGSTRSKFPSAAGENKSGEDSGEIVTVKMERDCDVKVEANLREGNSCQFLACLDDLERGLDDLDEEALKLEFFEGGFFDDQFSINDANWFVDQYNPTISGAC